MSGKLPDLKIRVGSDASGVGPGFDKTKKGLSNLDKQMSDMGKRAKSFGLAVSAGIAAAAAAGTAMAVSAGRAATEISNLSRVANTTPEKFQKWAVAARSVGVEQGKLSDILKDTTDKVGEFLSTGGGPMADFFENIAPMVGVTASQFANLSGPEALQLYVDSLEKAGLSQQQMTFYLEAMASDVTALLPLLRDSGKEMGRLGDDAAAAGRIISDEMVAGGVEMDKIFQEITETLKTSATKAVLEHKEEIIELANFIADEAIPALFDLGEWLVDMAKKANEAIEPWKGLGRAIAAALGIGDGGGGAFEGADPPDDPGTWSFPGARGDASTTGTWDLDENGNPILPGDFEPFPVLSGMRPKARPAYIGAKPGKTGSTKNAGGGAGDRLQAELERMTANYVTEQEMLDQHLNDQLKKLEEFRAAKLEGELDFNELEERIRKEHLDQMEALERGRLNARLNMIGGALGDLSALMSMENEKLFKIGKAAAVAEATVSGYQAAVDAWEKGMGVGGPPVAAAFTAASLARTGAMIAQISSARIGSGGSGGSTAGSSAAPAAVAPQVPAVNIAWTGDMSPNSMGSLTEKLNREYRQGYRLNFVRGAV